MMSDRPGSDASGLPVDGMEGWVVITVIVELRARQGARPELLAVLERIVTEQGPSEGGFLGSTRYEVLDEPDAIIEIADWESAEARTAHLQEAAATGVYAALTDLLAAPVRATVIRRLG
jgi:quinol monooxygenase YgiN